MQDVAEGSTGGDDCGEFDAVQGSSAQVNALRKRVGGPQTHEDVVGREREKRRRSEYHDQAHEHGARVENQVLYVIEEYRGKEQQERW